jgi:murein DD-endopeptidase MepM/ murein hydrolase activator NlpD
VTAKSVRGARSGSRSLGGVLALLSFALGTGCMPREDPAANGERIGIDSVRGNPVPGAEAAPRAGSDTALRRDPARTDTASRTETPRADEVEATASLQDLAELGAALAVPVAGVAPGELRDTYAEARGGRVHEALDIAAARGTPVLSAADGRLLRLFDSEPGGLMVYAADPSGRFILYYGHLDGYAEGLREGMPLVQGQVIGYVGTTGNAPPDAPHLHFGILRGNPDVSWWKGTPINPYPLLVAPKTPD